MSTPVSDVLLDPVNRSRAVSTLTRVIGEEVASKRGISGRAVQAAYAAVRLMGRHLVPEATEEMLPDFARALDPFWVAKGDADFGDHLAGRGDDAAQALLAVTDAKAQEHHHAALAAIYGTLRGRATEHVVAALPRLGRAISSLMDDPHGPPGPEGAPD